MSRCMPSSVHVLKLISVSGSSSGMKVILIEPEMTLGWSVYTESFRMDYLKGKKALYTVHLYWKDWRICLLRNLYAGREATVRTGHGTTDWFQIGKGVCQVCVLSPCLFNLYAEYIMRNAGLEETQAGLKIAGRNINNLRYADDTTLVAESEEKASWWKWKWRVKKLA